MREAVEDQYRKVLVAVDVSDTSRRVLAAAAPWCPAAALEVINAFEAPFASRLASLDVSSASIDAYAREQQNIQRQTLGDMIAEARLGPRVETRVVRGEAVTVILAEVQRFEPDLVIMGKLGAGFVNPALGIGSTVLGVTFGTSCDILQIP